MSDPRDKLPAIAGVAEELHVLWGSSDIMYYAGLWSCELIRGLLWKVFNPKIGARRPGYRAPSWSWASSNGQVVHSFTETDPVPYHFEILGCNVTLRDPSFPFGEIQDGVLRVSGVTKEAQWLVRRGRLLDPGILDAEEVLVGLAYPDDQELQPSRQRVLCLLIADPAKCSSTSTPYHVLGLVLSRKPDGTYERVGAFGLHKRDWFEDGKHEVLKIV